MITSIDSHVVEPPDLWTDRLGPEWGDRAPRLVAEDDADWWYVDGLRVMSVHGGADVGVRFDDQEQLRMAARFDEVRPGAYDPDAKLADMALDGVGREVLYPTLGLQLWRIPDAAFLRALFAAYNDWIAELCAAHPDRLAGVAMVLIDDVDAAVAELERVAALGLAGAMIPVHPGDDGSYDRPGYERLWAAAADAAMPLSLHIGTNRSATASSSPASATSGHALKFLSTPARYSTVAHWVQLSLADLVFAGVFERHPGLRVVSLEHEAAWAPHLLQAMDYTYTQRARRAEWHRFADPGALPSDFFRDNVTLCIQEDALAIRMRDVIGVGALAWGSDYPHAESTFPRSREILAEMLSDVSADEAAAILHDTPTSLYFAR